MTRMPSLKTIVTGCPQWPPIQALPPIAFGGAVILSTVLAGWTLWYLDRIPARLLAEAREALTHRPGLQPLVSVNGRDLILSGTLEPTGSIEPDIEKLEALAGVRSVTNRLTILPRPSPQFRLERCEDGITLQGHLTGEDLDRTQAHVGATFPDVTVQDLVRIDDRLAHPLWLTGLTPLLRALSELACFTLVGTRDHIRVEGAVETVSHSKALVHRVRNGLDPAVTLSTRLWSLPDPSRFALALTADSVGATLTLQTSDAAAAKRLRQALKHDSAFGPQAVFNLTLDPVRETPKWFDRIAEVLPVLGLIHDLRLISSGPGLWMWGQVPDAEVLSRLKDTLKARGLAEVVVSHLTVRPAGKPVELSLFGDRSGLILRGRLPNTASRSLLLEQLKSAHQNRPIQVYITLDADIRFNPWSIPWPTVWSLLPKTPFGLTIADDHILLTGQTSSEATQKALIRALTTRQPDRTLVDWLTLKSDDGDHDLSSG